MKKLLILCLLFTSSIVSYSQTIVASRMNELFQRTDLVTNLHNPWEVIYGPDGFLWVTESRGYRVFRINPSTGARTTILNISQDNTFLPLAERPFNLQFDFALQGNPQGGLAGMAIHPDFNAAIPKKYVYISYIHKYVGTASNSEGVFFINNLVRFTYNTGLDRLENPVSLCDTLAGSSDHNSQRMIIAPVGGVDYLFYAAGDMGSGQFGNRNRPQNAQLPDFYEGKILRFNLEPDGDAGLLDQWIPDSNPYNTTSPAKQSAVWSIGIRNNQGFAYNPATGLLYGSSHGPYSDDEINIIEPTKNYGHPLVIGFSGDGNYNGSSAGANNGSTCPPIVSESANALAIGADYRDPIFSAYARPQAEVNNIYLTNPGNGGWPSEGWSGLDIYTQTAIPGWKNSLLSAGLKWGRIIRTKLNNAGTAILPTDGYDTVNYFRSINRFRDLAITPDGKTFFVIMDQNPVTSGPSVGNTIVPACPGCVQKYTFLGYANDAINNKSTIPSSIEVDAGTPGSCAPASSLTIDNTNNSIWVPITGPDGNIVAEINANGHNLGNVTASFFINNAAVREDPTRRLYLDRNITISVQNPVPQGATAKIRLYITDAELQALVNATTSQGLSSGVEGAADLRIRKNDNSCGAVYTNNNDSLINPVVSPHANGYVLQGETKSFSTFYFTNPTAVTLPVQLLSFKGWLINNTASLQWVTTNESNTAAFIIERSLNGRNFEVIGNVAAAGTSNGTTSYAYTDKEITSLTGAIVYYRLRMMDVDGQSANSGIVNIRLADIAGKVSVLPNPAATEVKVNIMAAAEGTARLQLMDNTGRVILQSQLVLQPGRNSVPVNISSLANGLYYISVQGAGIDQKVKLQKL